MIHTADGLVPIEEINEGDLVRSWNDDLERAELHPVVETYVNPSRELAHLTVHGETIACTSLLCSAERLDSGFRFAAG